MLEVKGIPKLERLFRLAAQLDVDNSDLQRYTIHEFNRISAEIDLQPLVDYLAARPLLDLAYSDETDEELPRIFGGISVGLARTFKTLEPDLKNPQSKHWELIPATTMRAAAIDRFGGSEVLTLHVLPVPEIDPSEVLIAIQTAGVGSWDADMRDGWWPDRKRPSLPLVLGTDGSGTIAAVGSRVRRFALGDTVYAYSFANPKGGFYAEYVAVAAEKVGRLPASLSPEEAGAVATTGRPHRVSKRRGARSARAARRFRTGIRCDARRPRVPTPAAGPRDCAAQGTDRRVVSTGSGRESARAAREEARPWQDRVADTRPIGRIGHNSPQKSLEPCRGGRRSRR